MCWAFLKTKKKNRRKQIPLFLSCLNASEDAARQTLRGQEFHLWIRVKPHLHTNACNKTLTATSRQKSFGGDSDNPQFSLLFYPLSILLQKKSASSLPSAHGLFKWSRKHWMYWEQSQNTLHFLLQLKSPGGGRGRWGGQLHHGWAGGIFFWPSPHLSPVNHAMASHRWMGALSSSLSVPNAFLLSTHKSFPHTGSLV